MARLGCLAGVALIGVSVVALVGMIVLPIVAEPDRTGDQASEWMEALLCKSGETYTQEEYTIRDSRGTSQNIDMYCVDAAGSTRNVTGRMIVIAGAAFTIPFLLGLGLTIFAGTRMRLQSAQTFVSGPDANAAWSPGEKRKRTGAHAWDVGGTQISVDPQSGQVRINGRVIQASGAASAESLSDRLQELEDAYSKNLITRDEYERLRRRILEDEV